MFSPHADRFSFLVPTWMSRMCKFGQEGGGGNVLPVNGFDLVTGKAIARVFWLPPQTIDRPPSSQDLKTPSHCHPPC